MFMSVLFKLTAPWPLKETTPPFTRFNVDFTPVRCLRVTHSLYFLVLNNAAILIFYTIVNGNIFSQCNVCLQFQIDGSSHILVEKVLLVSQQQVVDSSIHSIVYLVRQCYGSLCFAPDNKTHESKTLCLLSAIQNEAVNY